MDLVRPARIEGDTGNPCIGLGNDACAGDGFVFDDRAPQAAVVLLRVLPPGVDLARNERWDVRIGVDLPVRVLERYADLLALVFERKDVVDLRPRTELECSMRPDAD